MELHKLTHHCWYSDSEPLTDRPSLGYILSDSGKSIVVDAGNSPAHYNEFLSCLDRNGFPYPSLCVITHSHWDHTLGISKVRVPVIACALTQLHLAEMKSWTDQDLKEFYDSDSCVREEYPTLDMISPSIASVVFKRRQYICVFFKHELYSSFKCMQKIIIYYNSSNFFIFVFD